MLKNLVAVFFMVLMVASLSVEAQWKKNKYKELGSSQIRKAESLFTEAEKYFILEDFEKALGLFEEALDIDPNNAAAHYKIAQIQMGKENLEEALEHAQKAVHLRDENKFYYLLASEIHTKMGQFEQAAQLMESMISKVKNARQYMFELAALYLYQGDLAKAIETYDQIEQRYGLSEQVVFQKQSLYLKLNDLESALAEGEKLIEAYPNEPLFTLKQAEVLVSNGQKKEAKEVLQEFIQRNPSSPEVKLMMGEIYQKEGELDSAMHQYLQAFSSNALDLAMELEIMAKLITKLPDFKYTGKLKQLGEKVLEQHPMESDAYTVNGDLYLQSGDKDQALKYYKTALDLDGSKFGIWQNILNLEMSEARYDSVVHYSEEALKFFPSQASIYFYNGAAHLAQDDFRDAVFALEQAASYAVDNNNFLSVVYSQLGSAYNGLEQYEDSDQAFEKSLDYNPENIGTLNNYAYFLSLREEDLELAKKMSFKTVNASPEDPNYLDTYGWILYKLGEYQEAKEYLERALQNSNDNSGTILEHYGDVLFKLGEVDQAVEQWKKARGKDDSSDLIDKKIADRKLYE